MLEALIVLLAMVAAGAVILALLRLLRVPRRAATILAIPFGVLIIAIPAWFVARSRSFQFFTPPMGAPRATEKVIALTFDDGPTVAYTEPVLEILREEGVRATFFLTGAETERNPDLARKIRAEGHELGNHSWSHERMVFKSPAFVKDEIERTDALLRRAGQQDPIFFRSPYGKKLIVLPWYLWRHGRINVFWDIEPESYEDVAGDPAAMTQHVLQRARPGSIVLLHVMYPVREPSRRSLRPIIRELKNRGYRFVTISELVLDERSQAASLSSSDTPPNTGLPPAATTKP